MKRSLSLQFAHQLRQREWDSLQTGPEAPSWDVRPWVRSCLLKQAEFRALAEGESQAEPIPDIEEWHAVRLFRELAFYGLYGDLTKHLPYKAAEKRIEEMIERASQLRAVAPLIEEDSAPAKIIMLAYGRRQIEKEVGAIEPLVLALLGGVSEGRIRNLCSGENATFSSEAGKIPVEQAIKWLTGREAYWPSIWQDNEDKKEDREMINIPQASDGTVFHPALRRRNGFMVGEKGSEVIFQTYEEALEALSAMSEPRWRRPNPQGNWGIVKATGWVSLSRKELNQMRQ